MYVCGYIHDSGCMWLHTLDMSDIYTQKLTTADEAAFSIRSFSRYVSIDRAAFTAMLLEFFSVRMTVSKTPRSSASTYRFHVCMCFCLCLCGFVCAYVRVCVLCCKSVPMLE